MQMPNQEIKDWLQNGWFKAPRLAIKELTKHRNALALYLTLLSEAVFSESDPEWRNFKPGPRTISIKLYNGDVVFGRTTFARKLNMPNNTVANSLKSLIRLGLVTVRKRSGNYTILNVNTGKRQGDQTPSENPENRATKVKIGQLKGASKPEKLGTQTPSISPEIWATKPEMLGNQTEYHSKNVSNKEFIKNEREPSLPLDFLKQFESKFPDIDLSAEFTKFNKYYSKKGQPIKDWSVSFERWLAQPYPKTHKRVNKVKHINFWLPKGYKYDESRDYKTCYNCKKMTTPVIDDINKQSYYCQHCRATE